MALAHSRRTVSRSRKRASAMMAVSMSGVVSRESAASRTSADAPACTAAHAGRRSRTLRAQARHTDGPAVAGGAGGLAWSSDGPSRAGGGGMAWSGTVDSARARRALFGWVALMAPEMALRTAVTRWGWEISWATPSSAGVQCRRTGSMSRTRAAATDHRWTLASVAQRCRSSVTAPCCSTAPSVSLGSATRLGGAARCDMARRGSSALHLGGVARRDAAARRRGCALCGGGSSAQQRGEVAARFGGSAARLARWCGAVAVERRCGGSLARVAPGAGQQAAARRGVGGHRACRRRRQGAAGCSALCSGIKKRGLVLYIKNTSNIKCDFSRGGGAKCSRTTRSVF